MPYSVVAIIPRCIRLPVYPFSQQPRASTSPVQTSSLAWPRCIVSQPSALPSCYAFFFLPSQRSFASSRRSPSFDACTKLTELIAVSNSGSESVGNFSRG